MDRSVLLIRMYPWIGSLMKPQLFYGKTYAKGQVYRDLIVNDCLRHRIGV